MLRSAALILIFGVFLGPWNMAAAAESFRSVGGLYVIDCQVQGISEPCMIDSGVSTDLVLRPRAEFSALTVLGEGGLMGGSGATAKTAKVAVRDLVVGSIVADNPSATLSPTSRPYSLLGLGFFRRLGSVSFDFRSNTF